MDADHNAYATFKASVLNDTVGAVLDINATVYDMDVYSATNTSRICVLATSHSAKTVQLMHLRAPSRPRTQCVTIDLKHAHGCYALQHHVGDVEFAAIFWRLGCVHDVQRVAKLLSVHMHSDAILYVSAVDHDKLKELILCGDAHRSGTAVHIGRHVRAFTGADVEDVHTACLNAGMHSVFNAQLNDLADHAHMNLLPHCIKLCAVHTVRAYQVGVKL